MRIRVTLAAVPIVIGTCLVLASCSTAATPGESTSIVATTQSITSSQVSSVSPTTPAITIQSTVPVQTSNPSNTSVAPTTSTPSQIVSRNIIIDHTNWDKYNSQPQSVSKGVATLKVFFAHASVGGNVLEGMQNLNELDLVKYPLLQESVEGTPAGTTVAGTVYEYGRGNPPWFEKISSFESYLKNGWNNPKVDIVMNKFCYIDPTADWTAYRNSMVALEAEYPTTKFVYWTMPLTTNSDSEEVLRSRFNQSLRNWINTQKNKILFDLADIESWDPAGKPQTFVEKGATYEILYSGYAADEGHLNTNGKVRAATGLYSVLGDVATSKP
jgi:hypothetical protein